jgi:hypothetical protein
VADRLQAAAHHPGRAEAVAERREGNLQRLGYGISPGWVRGARDDRPDPGRGSLPLALLAART